MLCSAGQTPIWKAGRQQLAISGGLPFQFTSIPPVFGQGLLFGSVRLLEYGLAIWAAFFLFVLAYEEPALRSSFGADYKEFCSNVPRWIPRLRPWKKITTSSGGNPGSLS